MCARSCGVADGPLSTSHLITEFKDLFTVSERWLAWLSSARGPSANQGLGAYPASEWLGWASSIRTPQTTITAFINLLAVLEQNAGATWQDLLGGIDVLPDTGATGDLVVEAEGDEEFASFKL